MATAGPLGCVQATAGTDGYVTAAKYNQWDAKMSNPMTAFGDLIYGGAGRCTGTLISPHVVLTAKHCVQAEDAERPYSPGVLTVGFGDRVGATRIVRAARVYTTPGVYTTSATTGLGGALVGVDIGIIVLATPQDRKSTRLNSSH